MNSDEQNNENMPINNDERVTTRTPYKKISNEKRHSLIRLVCVQGQSSLEASNLLEINHNSAKTILNNYLKNNKIDKLCKGGSARTVSTADTMTKIEELVTFNPEFTLKEIKKKLEDSSNNNFSISIASINRCLQELKITMKQSHRELDRVNSPDKILLRKEYSLWFNNHFNNNFSRVVFIDESSFNMHLHRSRARSRQGTRAIVTVPTIRGRSISLLASMSITGMAYCKTISNSTVNANIFNEYVDELCKYLRDVLHMQNACLILDNARIHRRDDIARITSQYNFEFKFLSPYSYMLNPIENAFSKIKNGVRSRLRLGATGLLSDLMLSETTTITSNDSAEYFGLMLRNITNCAAELPYIHK